MNRYFRNGCWTRLEIVVWLAAMLVAIAAGILLFTGVAGSWAPIVVGGIAIAIGLIRMRAEAGRTNGSGQ
jgi:fatty acid desaturase